MYNKLISLVVFTSLFFTISQAGIDSYICPNTHRKFLDIVTNALQTNTDDISTIYYGANTYKILKKTIPKDIKDTSCSLLKKLFKPSLEVRELYYGLLANKYLDCSKLSTDGIIKDIQAILTNEKSPVINLHYAAEVLVLLGKPLPNPTKIAELTNKQLKADDAVLNLGHALHLASLLGNAGKFINDRIEDIIVQVDEIDGRILQWEGGLRPTSIILTGLLKFPALTKFNNTQTDKFANYLLSRVLVQTPKGISALLEAAVALDNSNYRPISLHVNGPAVVLVSKPELTIQVTNILGEPIKDIPTPRYALSATKIPADVVVLSKEPLQAGKKDSELVLPLKLPPGYYKISLAVSYHVTDIKVRVLNECKVKKFEIGVLDTDFTTAPELKEVLYPNKLKETLHSTNSGHKLQIKFTLSTEVHQAFLRLYSDKQEIIFVVNHDGNFNYKTEIDVQRELITSDTYKIDLIIGDAVITNSFVWNIGEIAVKIVSTNVKSSAVSGPKFVHGPKPEIQHLFREPDKRPPQFVSLLFTALTLTPFLVLIVFWLRIGVNLKNFTSAAVPFHVGFGAILGIFVLFWIKLDMFTTFAYLTPVIAFTFLSGYKVLSTIAEKKKP